MKTHLHLLLLCILFSCSKQHKSSESTEFAQGKGVGIVGKWKLVDLQNSNAEKENYYISFDSTGTVTATDFPCAGTYTFDQTKGEKLTDQNLAVSFKNCSYTKPALWYSIKGTINAKLMDNNNTLVLNDVNCDEGCSRTYKRLK